MDLNDLYYRHQVSLMMADSAACEASRAAHSGLAEGYASRIDALKHPFRPPELAELRSVQAEGPGEIIA
jgi:hypothetical protein